MFTRLATTPIALFALVALAPPSAARAQRSDAQSAANADSIATYKRACEVGEAGSCARLSALYSARKGGKKDARRARDREMYALACDAKNAAGCLRLGELHESRPWAFSDQSASVSFWVRACELGEMRACDKAASGYYDGDFGWEKDWARAFRFAKRGCDGGKKLACHYQSRILSQKPEYAAVANQPAGGERAGARTASADSVSDLPPV